MQNRLIIVFSLFTFLISFGQEKVASFSQKDKERKDIFTVVNESDKELALFFIDKKSLSASRFDKNFVLIDTLGIQFSKKEVAEITGHSRSKNQYYIYWEGSNSKELVAQHFDFDSKKTQTAVIPFDIGKEQIINKFTSNNIFYIVTCSKNSSILNFYRFENGKMDTNLVDCSAMTFLNQYQKKVTFWDLYKENSALIYHNLIENISSETPASLAISTNKKKAYVNDESVTFTFDVNDVFTQTITVNLSDFKSSQKSVMMPYVKKAEIDRIDSNSFLINDRLIQLKTANKTLALTVKDQENNVLKNIVLNADDEVDFKNSDIIQETGSIESTKILGSSNQLIRKLNSLYPSVSGYYFDEKYYLVIGGVSAPQQNGAMMGGMIGGFTGALIGSAFSNYSVKNLNSYSNKKVVYIQSIFDKDFNHVKGESKKLAFDKLRLFVEKNERITNQTVFKFNSLLYLVGWDKDGKEYSFYKFE